MLIKKEDVPSTPESMNCEQHGAYEVKYSQVTDDSYLKSVTCPKCALESLSSVEKESERQKIEDLKERRTRRLKKAGVSKRLINKTFDDWEARTKEQIYAKSKCEAIANEILNGEQASNLILSGSVGTGKTALTAAIANKLVDTAQVRIRKVYELMREIKSTFSRDSIDSEKALIDQYIKLDLFVLDEADMKLDTATENRILNEIIDGRNGEMRPTILISNLGAVQLREVLGPRIVDRLREDGGTVIPFDWDSYRK